jgi:hypothetical protein
VAQEHDEEHGVNRCRMQAVGRDIQKLFSARQDWNSDKPLELLHVMKAIHEQEDLATARQNAEQVAAKLKEMKLADAAALVLAGIEETL